MKHVSDIMSIEDDVSILLGAEVISLVTQNRGVIFKVDPDDDDTVYIRWSHGRENKPFLSWLLKPSSPLRVTKLRGKDHELEQADSKST